MLSYSVIHSFFPPPLSAAAPHEQKENFVTLFYCRNAWYFHPFKEENKVRITGLTSPPLKPNNFFSSSNISQIFLHCSLHRYSYVRRTFAAKPSEWLELCAEFALIVGSAANGLRLLVTVKQHLPGLESSRSFPPSLPPFLPSINI